ncbi:unnamed protein product, partial [Allacma fusca]
YIATTKSYGYLKAGALCKFAYLDRNICWEVQAFWRISPKMLFLDVFNVHFASNSKRCNKPLLRLIVISVLILADVAQSKPSGGEPPGPEPLSRELFGPEPPGLKSLCEEPPCPEPPITEPPCTEPPCPEPPTTEPPSTE